MWKMIKYLKVEIIKQDGEIIPEGKALLEEIKKSTNENFAEICMMWELFVLSELERRYGKTTEGG